MNTLIKETGLFYKEICTYAKSDKLNILSENLYLLSKEYSALKQQAKNNITLKKYKTTGRMADIALSLFTDGKILNEDEIIKKLSDYNLSLSEAENLSFFIICSVFNIIGTNKENEQTVSDTFNSYRKTKELDFERIISLSNETEKLLNLDPQGIYPKMDESAKYLYRKAIIKEADKKNISDYEYAKSVLEESKNSPVEKKRHIGFYIPSLNKDKSRTGKVLLILEIIFPVIVSFCISVLLSKPYMFFLTLFPVYETVKSLITVLSAQTVKETPLLKMNPETVKSEEYKTAIVISTLLFADDDYGELKNRLINIYRTSIENNNYICLLSDLKVSKTPENSDDEKVFNAVKTVSDELNKEYNGKFLFIIRNRTFCKTQNEYMGFERKRGAISEFCSAVKYGEFTNGKVFGNGELIKGTKYMLVLDSDTFLPNEQLQNLLTIAAHPLNRPEIDYKTMRTQKGYGIIMPKTETSLKSAHSSYFAHFYAGHGGINGYSTFTGEKYQRILNHTVFTGKGLIDIECFNTLLQSRFENEKILSHDIMEGIILRTAYSGDTYVTDSFPRSPQSYFARQHRWIRGDWQNILYCIKNKPHFSFTDYYQLADNIRRSLTPPVIFISIILSFFLPDKIQTVSAIISVIGLCSGDVFSILQSIISGNIKFITRLYYSDAIPSPLQNIIHLLISVSLLPVEALTNTDAAVRTLIRYLITKKNLLQWTTASQSDKSNSSVSPVIKGLFCGITGWFLVAFTANTVKIIGILFILAIPVFILSGGNAKYQSNHKPKPKQAEEIKNYARDMWKFFENTVTESENMLPPDNIAFFPEYRIAHRTSPTNIGLYLVSLLGAYDFDFISAEELYKKTKDTLQTVIKLPKYKGHLYNWYDTEKLTVLNPPYISTVDSGNFTVCLVTLKQGLKQLENKNKDFGYLAAVCEKIINETDFKFLYNTKRNLFHIGYNTMTNEKSDSYYDLLMSEARITSYYALSKRIVPLKHLSSVGRTVVADGRHTGPVSWSGTMFEYYMPSLFIPVYKNSVYDEALKFCLASQKKFARNRNVPWGVSESCFFSFDSHLNYQYKANSVPALALCKTDKNSVVISPYSSFLALSTDITSSLKNLKRLKETGAYFRYGFYESVDYTKSRINSQEYAIIKCCMSHHTGMSFISCVNAVKDNIMQKRFISDEYTSSALNLLEERVLLDLPVSENKENHGRINVHQRLKRSETVRQTVNLVSPDCNMHTNGELTFISSANGENILIYKNLSLFKRASKDILSSSGLFSAVKTDNVIIPFTFAPYYKESEHFSSEYTDNSITQKAEFKNIKLIRKFILHPEKNALTVKFKIIPVFKTEKINLLIYFEPSLTDINIIDSHPAFSKLFVTDEYTASDGITVFTKQKRNNENTAFTVCGFSEDIRYTLCTDREKALTTPDGTLSVFKTSDGDLSVSADKCCRINAELTKKKNIFECEFIISVSETKEDAINTFKEIKNEKHRRHLSLTPYSLDSLTGVYTEKVLRNIYFSLTEQKEITDCAADNSLDISYLWKYGISGDVPIITVNNLTDTQTVISFLKLHKILTLSGIKNETVFLVNDNDIYGNTKINKIIKIINSEGLSDILGRKNGLFVINESISDKNEINLIKGFSTFLFPEKKKERTKCALIQSENISPADNLKNGFTEDGYIINEKTPLPYCTVLANATFGTLVSNSSPGFSWSFNSSLNKITPWSNDTASDNHGEKLYIGYCGKIIDIIKGSTAYFGKNTARWYGTYGDLSFTSDITVPSKGMYKTVTVAVTNNSDCEKEMSLMYYLEIISGENGTRSRFIKSKTANNTVIFTNPLNTRYGGYVSVSSDNKDTEIIFGKLNCILTNPPESKNCCTLKCKIILPPKKTEIYKYILSFGRTENSALTVSHLKNENKAINELKISTGDIKFDTMFNVFLPMQIINSRLYGRTGFYQNSGAYGFRDQLQDVLSLIPIHPELVKKQIFRCASVQFTEGDVFHWFHIYLNKNGQTVFGNRTLCSDDYLWLPFAVGEYCLKTGDYSVLQKKIPYLSGENLKPGETEKCFEAHYSDKKESLYLHCIRAINNSFDFGKHSLPLIKCGDWNDSFNEIGKNMKGESVWLAMFLKYVLDLFIPVCEKSGDTDRVKQYTKIRQTLIDAVNTHAFSSDRYIRAFYDDGTPLGCAESEECKIDLLPQSFSVIAGFPEKEKNALAMNTAYKMLTDDKYSVIRLFTPGFSPDSKKAGYVNAYPVGIRENAGQYTHSAVWFCSSFFKTGNAVRGYELLNMLMPYNKPPKIYKTEPYCLSGDVYYRNGMKGRGGWSLYTGSAGWLYRTVYEDMFGLKMQNGKIKISPCIPENIRNAKIKRTFNSVTTEYFVN